MAKAKKKTKKTWYYVSWYDKYPIYEPAEGGYYYEGLDCACWYKFGSLARAKKWLKRWAEEYGYELSGNERHAYEESHYIGEGTVIHIETVQGIHTCGYVPYC